MIEIFLLYIYIYILKSSIYIFYTYKLQNSYKNNNNLKRFYLFKYVILI